MGKLWYIQTTDYSSVIKINDQTMKRHEEFKRMCYISERRQSKKATYCMTPTTETVKRLVVARCLGKRGW